MQMDQVVQALGAHADDEGTQINAFYCLAELANARDGACMQTFLDKGTPTATQTPARLAMHRSATSPNTCVGMPQLLSDAVTCSSADAASTDFTPTDFTPTDTQTLYATTAAAAHSARTHISPFYFVIAAQCSRQTSPTSPTECKLFPCPWQRLLTATSHKHPDQHPDDAP